MTPPALGSPPSVPVPGPVSSHVRAHDPAGACAPVPACADFPRQGASAVHDLVRAFRSGDPAAFAAVLDLAGPLLDGILAEIHEGARGTRGAGAGPVVAAVALPGHRTGDPNAACTRLLAQLAVHRPWLVPAPGLLVRTADAPEAKSAATGAPSAPPGSAPPAATGAASDPSGTLTWHATALPPGAAAVFLLDDVVRSGASIAAALAAAAELVANPPWTQVRIVPAALFRAIDGEGGAP